MKNLLTILILAGALGISTLLILFKPEPKEVAPVRPTTNVEIITVQPQDIQLRVMSQGTVLPRTESDLSAEVSGRIIEVANSFRAGGSFRTGDVLLRIDPADYEAAVASAKAELANAELTLAQEMAQAEQAAADWAALGEGEASDLTLRQPQLAQAKARIESARAQLKRAQRDLARTAITAPFDGRVLSTHADLGQYISATPASPVARIYATDRAEVRLPITTREADLLEAPDRHQRSVRLQKANLSHSPVWTARFVRMEATIDPGSRLLYAVAELQDPFEPNTNHSEPLRRGQFVTAEIEGRAISDAYVLPRYALRGSDTVYIVTGQNTLQTRQVQIIQSNTEAVIIYSRVDLPPGTERMGASGQTGQSGQPNRLHPSTDAQGLRPGDRVVISPIAYYVEGMPVHLMADE